MHRKSLCIVRIVDLAGSLRISLDLVDLVWHLFFPQVLVLFMSVTHLLLLRLFELVSLLVVQLGCLYLEAEMYGVVDRIVVPCMNQIRVL